MKKGWKRYLAFLLAVLMVTACFPVTALAAEPEGEDTAVTAVAKEAAVIPEEESAAEVDPLSVEPETAEASKPGSAVPVEEISVTRVNPLYAGVMDVSDLVQPGAAAVLSDVEYCSTVEEAGAAVRTQLKNRQETVTVGLQAAEYNAEQLTDVFDAALVHTGVSTEGDYLAWQYGGWRGSIGGYNQNDVYYLTLTYTVTYYTTAAQEAAVDAAVSELLSNLALDQKSDYETVKAIYDWICANVTYDYDNLFDDSYQLKYSAYAALVDHTAVCQGYAMLLYRLLLEEGIDVRVITGDAGGAHAWNIIRLGSLYYNADSTWDAGQSSYSYFLKCAENFPDHVRDAEYETAAFHAAYPMSGTDYAPGTSPDPEQPVDPDVVDSGTCGENLTWALDSEGTLTISGTGEMWDFEYGISPWFDRSGSINAVVIQPGVTGISNHAFHSCKQVTEMTIPETVTRIGISAFEACVGLSEIDIPANVTSIGACAFSNCTALEEITLHQGLKTIGNQAFMSCMSLREIVIPDSVTGLGSLTFQGCANLRHVVLPNGLTELDGTFWMCFALTDVVIPNTVTRIGISTFESCGKLEKIVIPDSVTSIDTAFSNCSMLKEIIFKGHAPTIGANNFWNVKASAYYPYNDTTWTENVRLGYGGSIAWVPYENPMPNVTMDSATASNDGITVRWNGVEFADMYQVYRCAASEGIWKWVRNTTATSYKDTAANANETYYYKVAARRFGEWSNLDIPAVSAKIVPLPNVTMVSATASNDGITVRWNAISNANLYQVYRCAASEGTWKWVRNTTATSYKDTAANANETYYYKVIARRSGTWSSLNISAVSAKIVPLPNVKMVSAKAVTNGITVQWNAVSGADLYQVYRCAASEGTWKWIRNTTAVSYTDTTAQTNETYYYKVIARRSGTWSSLNIPAVSAARS